MRHHVHSGTTFANAIATHDFVVYAPGFSFTEANNNRNDPAKWPKLVIDLTNPPAAILGMTTFGSKS